MHGFSRELQFRNPIQLFLKAAVNSRLIGVVIVSCLLSIANSAYAKTTPTLTLATSGTPSTYGSSVTFTATITSGTTGNISFLDGTTTIGTVAISGTTAAYTTSSLSVGSHSIKASYPGDANYNSVTSSVKTQVVSKATPTLTVATSGTPSNYGASVTFTATISAGPTGTISFFNGATSMGTVNISGTTAAYSTSTLTGGSRSITAKWLGDSNYNAVTSSAITQVVNKVTPTITWSSPSAITYGTALSSTQLNASASVGGSFSYSPASGTVLQPGSRTLSVTFTPSDTTDYNTATGSVSQSVLAIPPASVITTFAGNPNGDGYLTCADTGPATVASLESSDGVALDSAGNVYIADTQHSCIRKVDASTGVISTIAGTGTAGYSGDNGPAVSAQISWPSGIAVDRSGNIYFADTGNAVIREISASGTIATIAGDGTGNWDYTGDGGPAKNARFAGAVDVAIDSAGNLYIADSQNMVVRKVSAATGIITTVAGNGTSGTSGDGGQAISAELNYPYGVAVDAVGNLYIADMNNNRVRKVDGSTGVITTVAGNGTQGYTGDNSAAVSAELNNPIGVTVDAAGNLYITDSGNQVVRKVAVGGTITTIAGNGSAGYSGDGGPAVSAELNGPWYLATDASGNVYIAEDGSNRVRLVGSNVTEPIRTLPTITWANPIPISYGTVLSTVQLNATANVPGTFAYSPSLGTVVQSGLRTLSVLFTPDDTTHYSPVMAVVPITIQQLIPTITWANPAPVVYGTPLSSTQLNATANVPGTFDYSADPEIGTVLEPGTHTLLVTFTPDDGIDYATTEASVSLVVQGTPGAGVITTVAGNGVNAEAGDGGPAIEAALQFPEAVALDSAGNLYIPDSSGNKIRKVSSSNGTISTIAGTGTAGFSGDGDLAVSAKINGPVGIAVDAAGNVYFADTVNNRIRKITSSTGTITTIVGTGVSGYSGDGGAATSAQINSPFGIAFDSAGNLYFSDTLNSVIRKVNSSGTITTVAGNGFTGYSGDGGAANQAELNNPGGIAIDSAGNIYIADVDNKVIRKVTASTGKISTIAGIGVAGNTGDGGPAINAKLDCPKGVALDSAGNLFILDYNSFVVRRVAASDGTISTVAGNGTGGFSGDGGPAINAQMSYPSGLAVDLSGNIYIADCGNNRIRLVGGSASSPSQIAVSVSPSTISLHSSGQQQFTAAVTNSSNQAVNWTVVPNGAGTGSISSGGLYTAPSTTPVQQTVTVVATSQADPSKSATASVTLQSSVAITIDPESALLHSGESLEFDADVTNANDTSVVWTISPAGTGTIDADGTYTAPASIATQQTVTVTATSRADSSKSVSATLTLNPSQCGVAGYSYIRAVTIDHTKVPNTHQINFPFLFNITDPALATTASGGHLSSAAGFDMVFASDSQGQTKLDFEIEEYNPAIGRLVAWVRIPDLSPSADTVIYILYGNSNVTSSQQNPAGVWSTGFTGVWHFPTGTSLSANDSTTHGGNGTITGATSAPGRIGGGSNFNGSSNYIVSPFPSSSIVSNGNPFSISLWLKTTDSDGTPFMIAGGQNAGSYTPGFSLSGGRIRSYVFPLSDISGGVVNDGAWHLVTETYSNSTVTLYVDGKPAGTTTGTPYDWSGATVSDVFDFGSGYGGSIDEVRVAPAAFSSDWISTEYANESSPSSFYSISPESINITPLKVDLYAGQAQQFAAVVLNSCGSAVTWSMPSGSPGTLSANGLYTAPSAITTTQRVNITATDQADSALTSTAVVTLLTQPRNPTLSLSASVQPPYVTGTSQSFSVTFKDQYGLALPNAAVSFAVTGANTTSGTGTTDSNGVATFSYSGANSGNDTIQATSSGAVGQVSSNNVFVSWVVPSASISMTSSLAKFFPLAGPCCWFNISPSTPPLFTQVFPTINFDPPAGSIPGNTTADTSTHPFTDITLDKNGNFSGSIVAQGNGYQAGSGPLTGFEAVFTGSFIVKNAGDAQIPVYVDNAFFLGIGGGAVRIDPIPGGAPSITPFEQYPVMGGLSTSIGGTTVRVHFPAAGTYPFELDYVEDGAGLQSLMMMSGAPGGNGLAPGVPSGGTLSLSPASVQPQPIGATQNFTVTATDAAGNPVPNLPIGIVISQDDVQQLSATTNSSGVATFQPYTNNSPGTDQVQAVAIIGGMVAYSNIVNVPWTSSPGAGTPGSGTCASLSVTASAPSGVILPNALSLTGSASDSQGGTISYLWSKVSGPANVTFANPTQSSTTATFTVAGNYVLQLAAGDANCGSAAVAQINVSVGQTVASGGWIGSPTYGASVSGIVPIQIVPSESIASGQLTVYPAGHPEAVTILNGNVTGSGQIASWDTTRLSNGTYWITLQATDSNNNSEYNLALVTVVGNYKPGRVTSTVTDLVVPAKGLAIKIQRTYDSLNADRSGDFGFGWSLGTSTDLAVDPKGNVTFTLGGQRRTFYLTPQILGWFVPFYVPVFTPEPGMHGTLVNAGTGCTDLFDYLVPDGSLWACVGGGLFTPPAYVYTDPSGTAYTMTADGQLRSIVDKNGNTLTVTPSGITSSTGLSVSFQRDSSGRITQITEFDSQQLPLYNYLYGYDANGNLASVTYPNTPIAATYSYIPGTHYYQSGTDFRGNQLPSTTYFGSATDAHGNSVAGKLESITDALGETTNYVYDLTANTTAVTYPQDGSGNRGTATMAYDLMGNLLSSTDPLGHTTTNSYDAKQNLLSTTDPLGHKTCYTYDGNGNRTSVSYPVLQSAACSTIGSITSYNQYSEPNETIDELGNVRYFNYDVNFNPQTVTDSQGTLASFVFNNDGTMQAGAIGYDLSNDPSKASHFAYDANGNLSSRVDALGRTTSYTYNSLGQKSAMVEPLLPGTNATEATTTYTYDPLGNLTETDAPLGRISKSTYDANGNKIDDTDALQHKTTYSYDALNRLNRTDYADSTYTHKTYDFRSNVIDEWDKALPNQTGIQTHHVYDLAGRETSVTRAYGTPNAATTTFTYYDDGRKNTEKDALGHATTYTYDIAGDLTGVSGVSGAFTYGYDLARNRTSMTDGNGKTTSYIYDARKRLIETNYPDANHTKKTNGYDGSGNLTSVIDQAGNEVDYTYDAANQLQSVVQTSSPNGNNITSYSYDPLGNLIGLNDANSHLTESAFDLLSQPSSKTLPDGSLTESRQYDAAGNLTSLTHFNGKTTTYTYDSLNRLKSRTPDPSTGEHAVNFTYTATGKRYTMDDASGTTTYGYDSMDRLTTKATPEGTLTYGYDAAGHLASMSSSHVNGVSVSYTYDSLNRLKTVIDSRLAMTNQTTTYGYDNASNVGSITYPNTVQYGFNYDELNRMKQTATSSQAGPLTGYLYTLDAVGNRTDGTELNGRKTAWTYDNIYRVQNETVTLDPNNKNGSVSYGLDPVGNRTSVTSGISGLSPVAGMFNQDDEISSESYDSNGNVTASGGKTFSYNTDNQLVSMNGGAVTIVYDGDGNRVKKIVGGVTTQYLVDDLNPTGYPQVVEELANGAVSRTYTYGLQRISQNQVISNSWTPSFYGYDGFGTVRQLTNSTGTITDTYDYDTFGNKINSTGTTPNSYMYRGEQWDSDVALYYLRARYYNPTTGRFMSRDPDDHSLRTPNELHKYLYAAGDPVNAIDPSGRGLTDYAVGVAKTIWKVPTIYEIGVAQTVCLATLADIFYHISSTHGASAEQNPLELGLAAFTCGTAELGAIRYLWFLIP